MLSVILKLKAWLIKGLEIIVILIMFALVIDVIWGVFTRYVWGHQSQWTDELAKMLLIWIALLGASIGFIKNSHLGVDYFVNKLNEKSRKIGQLIVYMLISVFAAVVLIYGGYRLVSLTLTTSQPSPALHIEMGYVYLALPISGFFIVIFSIEMMVEKISLLLKK
ncbi:MAG: TRAP transporter small permease [Phycisphaerales bacterium]|jgi:TRAP-type C4-dicarboxylate transport system permease small subunit